MPFVQIPKDLNTVKTKIIFNLTKRQLICFSLAALVGVPSYIFTRGAFGSEGAVLIMIGLMLPFFFIAMYEKDGQHAEKILRNYIRTRIFFKGVRPYKTENLYAIISKEGKIIADENKKANPTGKTTERRKKKSEENQSRAESNASGEQTSEETA